MQPLTRAVGPAAPLMMSNVDTDTIIRIERLTELAREQLGPFAFEALRYDGQGREVSQFVLNRPEFREAPILLAEENFGCGSSREAAVFALLQRGVRCVIAPTFGDIFYGNCFQNGLLPIRLPAQTVRRLADEAETGEIFEVDLEQQTVISPSGRRESFEVAPTRRTALLKGLNDLELTLLSLDAIRNWQSRDKQERPWAWRLSHGDACLAAARTAG